MALSRRDFLRRGTAVTAAGLAMPAIIPSTVFGAQGQPGANEKVGVACIGVGRRGQQVLAEAAASPLAQIVAVCDVDLPRAKSVGEKYGCDAYQDYHELLARDDVDAVISATVDHWRALTVIHACQAGKDVYVEKPMSHTIREGRLMVQAARKYGRIVQTGSQQRSMAANRKGCELIRNGAIGKVKRVIAHNFPSPWEDRLPEQPIPEGLNWDLWCGPVEPVPYHIDLYTPRANPGWISFRTYSGGEMTGWGAHGLDQVQWALGMDESGPIEVWTEGPEFDPPTYTEPTPRDPGEKACSNPTVFMRYAGDIVMELTDPGLGGGARFEGEDGAITIDRAVCKCDPEGLADTELGDDAVRLYASDDHMGNWLECVRSRELPVADVEIGHRSTTVCHLGNIARWAGRKLTWDPVGETFVGDDAANGYLDRERRAPYTLPDEV